MRCERLTIGLRVAAAIFSVTLLLTNTWAAGEKILHSFDYKDGAGPCASLIFDAAGNFYGTTAGGGRRSCNDNDNDCGTVFELTPKAGGGWTEKALHKFNGKDGSDPVAGLIFDGAGNLYGTTFDPYGFGTVFKLSPKAGGGWTRTVLHSFNSKRNDGLYPYAGLVFDTSGNLYGTTELGGAYNEGTVFELISKAGGAWTEKILHSFKNNSKDGNVPVAGLIIDGAGNLYGTTEYGGADGEGTVFELTPKADGVWTETILHSFSPLGKDGYNPLASLIFDSADNLYGTTVYGGSGSCNLEGEVGCGTIFELTPKAGGGWTETVLHNFNSNGKDGNYPYDGLILDAFGNMYGTTASGGNEVCFVNDNYGCGTIFELTPKAGGGWTETVLHNFNSNGKDGIYPYAGLILDAFGNLYGTTTSGGHDNAGTVFELTPKARGAWTEGP